MTKIKNDPENYYKLSEPFESSDACNEALTKFHEELSELRKKYKIRDLLVVTYGSVKYEDGKVSDFMQHSGFGNSINQLPMSAYAYGQLQAENRERMNHLIAGNMKGTK